MSTITVTATVQLTDVQKAAQACQIPEALLTDEVKLALAEALVSSQLDILDKEMITEMQEAACFDDARRLAHTKGAE